MFLFTQAWKVHSDIHAWTIFSLTKENELLINIDIYFFVSPVISITGKKYVDLGERIHLVCNASGGPRIPDEIDWFKAGDKIDSTKYR